MTAPINHQFRLARRPVGMVQRSDFEYTHVPVAQPGDGEVLIKVLYLSLDPAMRGWMNEGKSYVPPVGIGEVMRAGAVGRVIASNDPGIAVGDHVVGMLGAQEYAVAKPKHLTRVDPRLAPLPVYLGTLGMPGMTAYFGLLEVGKPKTGDTVVVSGAAGAVGQVVGQIAKIKGCRVVGIAGGRDKCDYLRSIGFDAAIDYKHEDVGAALDRHCPNGIDVDFENVGGEIMNEVFSRMNNFGRMSLCGMISTYNKEGPIAGPTDFGRILMHRLMIKGFIIIDYLPRAAEAFAELGPLVASGRLKWKAHVEDGLENAVEAVGRLFTGDHDGKLLLRVSPEP